MFRLFRFRSSGALEGSEFSDVLRADADAELAALRAVIEAGVASVRHWRELLALCQREDEAGVHAAALVILNWGFVPADAKGGLTSLPAAARKGFECAVESPAGLLAIDAAHHFGGLSWTAEFCRVLANPDPARASAAARALERLAAASMDGGAILDEEQLQALAGAAADFDRHRCTRVLAAFGSALTPRATRALNQNNACPGWEAAAARWLRSARDAGSVRRAIELISNDAIAGAAIARLRRIDSPGEVAELLAQSWRLAHPRRARRFKSACLSRLGRVVTESLHRQQGDACHGAARVMSLLPVTAASWAVVARSTIHTARLLALQAAPQTWPAMLDDRETSVVRSAAVIGSAAGLSCAGRASISAGAVSRRIALCGKLAASADVRLRAIAREDGAFHATHEVRPDAARADFLRALAVDHAAAVGRLRCMLGAESEAIVRRAIDLARRAGLISEFTAELKTIVARSDVDGARSAAAAITALGASAERAVLIEAMDHPNARVRANAVDASASMARRTHSFPGRLAHVLDDAAHRPRASAARAVLWSSSMVESKLVERAATALFDMAADSRAEHRLAAAWLIGTVAAGRSTAPLMRARLVQAIDPLTRDPDARVRTRANWATFRADTARGVAA